MTRRTAAVAILVVLALAAGCARTATVARTDAAAAGATGQGELVVFAAASLRRAVEQAAAAFEASHPGTTVTVSTDSSSALATQIEQGAPADVFLSADTTNPQKLVDGGFAADPATPFAANALTVVTPTDNPAGLASSADLAQPGVRIIAARDAVPITPHEIGRPSGRVRV